MAAAVVPFPRLAVSRQRRRSKSAPTDPERLRAIALGNKMQILTFVDPLAMWEVEKHVDEILLDDDRWRKALKGGGYSVRQVLDQMRDDRKRREKRWLTGYWRPRDRDDREGA